VSVKLKALKVLAQPDWTWFPKGTQWHELVLGRESMLLHSGLLMIYEKYYY